MFKQHPFATAMSLLTVILFARAVSGQDFPNKPIRFVAAAPGGSADIVARLISPGITSSIGQQVIIDNRAIGLIQAEIVSKAQPDGYTLMIAGSSTIILPLMQKTSYDPIRDFAPITLAVTTPSIVVVNPSVPIKSIKELIALAKARPDELNYGSSGNGSSGHFAGELFKSMAGVKLVHIAYKGNGPALLSLVAGQIQLGFPTATSVTPHVNSGKLRGIAVTSTEPTALAPGMPTVAAAGLPGYESVAMTLVLAPAKTPATIVQRLNREIVRVIKQPDIREKLFGLGVEAVGSSSEHLAATMKAESVRLSKVIRDAGIKGE